VILYTILVILSYRHKGLQRFAEIGSKAGIQPPHAKRLRNLLTALDAATQPGDMNAQGYGLHALRGELEGHWAVSVSGNWRLTFAFHDENVVLVDYQDYH
jgi:proteic killer suppression protein